MAQNEAMGGPFPDRAAIRAKLESIDLGGLVPTRRRDRIEQRDLEHIAVHLESAQALVLSLTDRLDEEVQGLFSLLEPLGVTLTGDVTTGVVEGCLVLALDYVATRDADNWAEVYMPCGVVFSHRRGGYELFRMSETVHEEWLRDIASNVKFLFY